MRQEEKKKRMEGDKELDTDGNDSGKKELGMDEDK